MHEREGLRANRNEAMKEVVVVQPATGFFGRVGDFFGRIGNFFSSMFSGQRKKKVAAKYAANALSNVKAEIEQLHENKSNIIMGMLSSQKPKEQRDRVATFLNGTEKELMSRYHRVFHAARENGRIHAQTAELRAGGARAHATLEEVQQEERRAAVEQQNRAAARSAQKPGRGHSQVRGGPNEASPGDLGHESPSATPPGVEARRGHGRGG